MTIQTGHQMFLRAEVAAADTTTTVNCLGATFPSQQARRDHFREELATELRRSGYRMSSGFPAASDESIFHLSDPPYYTACPNPFLRRTASLMAGTHSTNQYQREPFAFDVEEGKNEAIYNAHSYHTKVPPKAILRYILHYTNPGDVILDGFCGTGMTGVAAQLCADRQAVQSLGYSVNDDGQVTDVAGRHISNIGARAAILADISSIALFIAAGYTSPIGAGNVADVMVQLLQDAHDRFGAIYAGAHGAEMEYRVWPDVLLCSSCSFEVCYWDNFVDTTDWRLKEVASCPNCGSNIKRGALQRAMSVSYDPCLQRAVTRAKKVGVWEVWNKDGKRLEVPIPQESRLILGDYGLWNVSEWIPTDEIPSGDKTSDPFSSGISHVHQYWYPDTLRILAYFWSRAADSVDQNLLRFWLTSGFERLSIRSGYRPQHKNNKGRELGGPMSGNLYIPSLSVELNPLRYLKTRVKSVARMLESTPIRGSVYISNQASNMLHAQLPEDSIDYIFVDPPFGSNIMYSELNYAGECWLRVKTNQGNEAIVNRSQHKEEAEYSHLMYECFREFYRVLKPGRWMTVEFHNSRNAIWTAIQEALSGAGFIVADVRGCSIEMNCGI